MPYLAESAVSAAPTMVASHQGPAIDFMRRAYDLNGEPLRLLDGGQRWFARVLSAECELTAPAAALVLGATPWLGDLLRRTAARTSVVDASASMLALCAATMAGTGAPWHGEVELRQGNWLSLPDTVDNLQVVAGDNALNFLRYPDQWSQFLDRLADRMTDGGVVLARMLSVPATHRCLSPAEIVEDALRRRAPVNFTAIRVALLFAHWDRVDFTITPERALATFEAHRREFDRLASEHATENDLLSIEKYRGTGATYFVPPLADALAQFERRFTIRSVHFGPYQLSRYFPLIVAARRPR